uniref:Uncharacterized protein n=1 Tax=Fagus sylvatica TaxID=28930 RepID=A0A2N9HEM4_FAGSY
MNAVRVTSSFEQSNLHGLFVEAVHICPQRFPFHLFDVKAAYAHGESSTHYLFENNLQLHDSFECLQVIKQILGSVEIFEWWNLESGWKQEVSYTGNERRIRPISTWPLTVGVGGATCTLFSVPVRGQSFLLFIVSAAGHLPAVSFLIVHPTFPVEGVGCHREELVVPSLLHATTLCFVKSFPEQGLGYWLQ